MLVRLLAFLRQPYPVPDGPAAQLRRALLIGLFVGAFLVVFQPFGLSAWQTPNKALRIAGFGVVSAVVTFGWYAGGPLLAPGFFRENRWTVGRAALFLNANIVLIAIGNVLYLAWLLDAPPARFSPGWMLTATFLIGLFPAAATTAATYIRELRRHRAGAEAARPSGMSASVAPSDDHGVETQYFASLHSNQPSPAAQRLLTFTADNGKDTLTLGPIEVLYLEAADNYCTVAHGPPGAAPTRTLLRGSLTRLTGQTAGQPGAERLARVHRSYLVNLGRVVRVSGNAQGYRLHLAADTEPVPVGRTYAEAVLAALRGAAVRP